MSWSVCRMHQHAGMLCYAIYMALCTWCMGRKGVSEICCCSCFPSPLILPSQMLCFRAGLRRSKFCWYIDINMRRRTRLSTHKYVYSVLPLSHFQYWILAGLDIALHLSRFCRCLLACFRSCLVCVGVSLGHSCLSGDLGPLASGWHYCPRRFGSIWVAFGWVECTTRNLHL